MIMPEVKVLLDAGQPMEIYLDAVRTALQENDSLSLTDSLDEISAQTDSQKIALYALFYIASGFTGNGGLFCDDTTVSRSLDVSESILEEAFTMLAAGDKICQAFGQGLKFCRHIMQLGWQPDEQIISESKLQQPEFLNIMFNSEITANEFTLIDLDWVVGSYKISGKYGLMR